MSSFAEMASMADDELPEVKLIPPGTYIAEIRDLPETKDTTKGTGENTSYRISLISPVEDFEGDEQALEEFGSVKGIVRSMNFFFPTALTDKIVDAGQLNNAQARALRNHNKWLRDVVQVEGETLTERMANCRHHQLLVTIGRRPHYQDKNEFEEYIAATAPIPG